MSSLRFETLEDEVRAVVESRVPPTPQQAAYAASLLAEMETELQVSVRLLLSCMVLLFAVPTEDDSMSDNSHSWVKFWGSLTFRLVGRSFSALKGWKIISKTLWEYELWIVCEDAAELFPIVYNHACLESCHFSHMVHDWNEKASPVIKIIIQSGS